MDDLTEINRVKELVKRIIESNRLREEGTKTASLATVVPYDPARRKTRDQRRDRKKRREKIEAAKKRKEANDRLVRDQKLKKD